MIFFAFLAVPAVARASEVTEEVIICPQPYGGGVVCGVKTHAPVEAGVGDSLPMIGSGLLGASAMIAYFTKKLKKSAQNCR